VGWVGYWQPLGELKLSALRPEGPQIRLDAGARRAGSDSAFQHWLRNSEDKHYGSLCSKTVKDQLEVYTIFFSPVSAPSPFIAF